MQTVPHPTPLAVTLKDAAAMLGLSEKTLRRLADRGQIRLIKVGRRTLVPYQDLSALTERTTRHPSP